MSRDQILSILRDHAGDLRRLGVEQLFLFGSASRDQAGPHSDVDLFFDYDAPGFSLIELVALRDQISAHLQTPADVMSRASIHPRLRSAIESSALRVF